MFTDHRRKRIGTYSVYIFSVGPSFFIQNEPAMARKTKPFVQEYVCGTNERVLVVLQLGRAHEQIIQPLERFRKEHIGAVKVTSTHSPLTLITEQNRIYMCVIPKHRACNPCGMRRVASYVHSIGVEPNAINRPQIQYSCLSLRNMLLLVDTLPARVAPERVGACRRG